MKILLVVESKHQNNTLKVARSMQKAADMEIIDTKQAANIDFHQYDIVGFGSGIYMGKHDKSILRLAKSLDDEKGYSFIVSTSGGKSFSQNNSALREILFNKNKVVLGEFSCLGLDKFFLLRLTGGVNKGKPDEKDLLDAQNFIRQIIADYDNRLN